jgi:putative peptidoglycan lipid II flippase
MTLWKTIRLLRRIGILMKNYSIGRSIGVILATSILAKFGAFITEAILAAYLGTSIQADAYYMIAGIQQVFYPMLSVGIWNVFMPEYIRQLTNYGAERADILANKMLILFTLVSIIMMLFLIICSGSVVSLVAPGFIGEAKVLCEQLVRISAPKYVFIVVSSVFAALLQSHGKFFGSQIREFASQVPMILIAIFLFKTFGVYALTVGLILGSVFRLIIQIPFIDWGYKFKFNTDFKDPNIILILKRLPAVMITAGVSQLNTLVDKIMASGLPTGTVSSLSYGNRLLNVFSGLLTTAVSTALYPLMSQMAAEKNYEKLRTLLVQAIYLVSIFIIPGSIACVLFSDSIVSVVFQRGAFDSESASRTAAIFSCYAVGMIFMGLKDIFSNVFYSFGNTKTPMRISIVTISLNIALNFIFVNMFGVAGLALATSIAAVANAVSLFYMLRMYIPIKFADISLEMMKIILISVTAYGIAFMCVRLLRIQIEIVKLTISALIGIVLYIIGLKLTAVESFNLAIAFMKSKFFKSNN